MSYSGLSLLSQLAERPPLTGLLAEDVEGPKNMITPVFYDGKLGSSSVVESFLLDLICRTCLPDEFKGVRVNGACAGVVFLNADHHLKIESLTVELQKRVNTIAELHYKALPKDRRSKERLTSMDQWQIVKRSMERVLVMEVYTPDTMEADIVKLRRILDKNQNISLVLISSINTFFHQVSSRTGIYHHAYLRRLLTYLVDATQDMQENLRVLYVQHNYFKRPDDFYNFRNPQDNLRVIQDSVRLSEPRQPGVYNVVYENCNIAKSIL